MTSANNLDKKLVHSLNQSKIPKPKQLKYLFKVLNQKERRLFVGATLVVLLSLAFIGVNFYLTNFIPGPAAGGQYTEGLIGAPQYINPLLSQTNDVDSDISRLVFSGLLTYDKNLQLIPDLAAGWEINDDQTQYTFTLRDGVTWHDGTPLTADDVIFTVQSVQDPDFKSPLLVSLRGVKIEKKDPKTIIFTLPEAYPAFLEVLTFGILPEHIWGEIPAINANLTEYNLKPIGAGAWQFKNLTKDRLGNVKSYVLEPYNDYYGPKPYLEKITFKFYSDFQSATAATKNNAVDGISFLPKDLKKELVGQKNLSLYSFALPQYTAIFFNQKQNDSLKERNVRKALQLAINKPEILTEALQLEGEIINGPLLTGLTDDSQSKVTYDPQEALDLLAESGWQQISPEQYEQFLAEEAAKAAEAATNEEAGVEETAPTEESTNPEKTATSTQPTSQPTEPKPPEQPFYQKQGNQILTIALTTVNQPENVAAVELIKSAWQAIGVKVDLIIIESGKISREIIKPRNYQALLFGVIVGSDPDPYPFWHSSQIQDPGLNLAQYANRNVDTLLEDARTTLDDQQRTDKYRQFQNILVGEVPAIFLYNPTYTYVVDKKIKGINTDRIIVPADRFNNLSDWYIKTKRVYRPDNF